MPALINIELYISLDHYEEQEIDTLLSSFENDKEVRITKSANQYPNYIFSYLPNIKFYNYRRRIELKENWYAIEYCTEYENLLTNESKQIVFNEGIKYAFLKIVKLINRNFQSPVVLITNEISNGFFFEHKFGNNSSDFADFELGLIKSKYINIIDSAKYKLIEENEEYIIYIQENDYVSWLEIAHNT